VCTLLILRRAHAKHAFVIAANRDEYYARPATGPRVLETSPRIVGGLDEVRGGTWMGATREGSVAVVTNQRTYVPADQAKRSRGEVVLETLRAGSPGAMREHVERLVPDEYNPFNLLFGDERELFVAYARRGADRMIVEDVADGVHVLPNDVLDSTAFAKVARVRAAVDARDVAHQTGDALTSALREILASHETAPLEAIPDPPASSPFSRELAQRLDAVCIHTPSYGTRSATIAVLEPGRVARYSFAPGPPCTAPFEDVTALVR